MNKPSIINERIQSRMTALGLSQSKLSEASQGVVERSALNRCLKGIRPWRRKHLAQLAPLLGITFEELVQGTEEEARFANEENAQLQIEKMEESLAETINRLRESEAKLIATQTQLEATQRAIDNRPTQDEFNEIKAKLASAEARERTAINRASESSKRLEEESAKRQAAEKERDEWRSKSDESVKLASANHQAAEQNGRIATYWKGQFEAVSAQLKNETARANHNYKVATKAEESANSAKGIAILTTTLGAFSLLSRGSD